MGTSPEGFLAQVKLISALTGAGFGLNPEFELPGLTAQHRRTLWGKRRFQTWCLLRGRVWGRRTTQSSGELGSDPGSSTDTLCDPWQVNLSLTPFPFCQRITLPLST